LSQPIFAAPPDVEEVIAEDANATTTLARLLSRGMIERTVFERLGVTHAMPTMAEFSLVNRSYHCRCKALPDSVILLQYTLGSESWWLREWRVLPWKEAEFLHERALRSELHRFREIDKDWVARHEEIIREISRLEGQDEDR
jgi:hypothetical protein